MIFLSMVDASDGEVLKLRQETMFRQRFNVAASRAKDQMWVVHSVDPRSHLKPGDLRRRLIEYAEDPRKTTKALEDIGDRTESDFEKQVATRLIRLGYEVVPQWRVGYYRIDLVVKDKDKRLGIECDGDRYHPIEQLAQDMARQGVLERLGWTFARIRGSQFFRDPDAAMEPVLARLRDLGIEPTADMQGPSPISGHVLRDRVVQRAQEIRSFWRENDNRELEVDADHGEDETTRFSQSLSRVLFSESDNGRDRTLGEHDDDAEMPSVSKPSLSKDLLASEVRNAIHTVVPAFGRAAREIVLREAAKELGFLRLSKKLRSRINRMIAQEVRQGRINRDSDWTFLWKDDSI